MTADERTGTAAATVRAYYDALVAEEPLGPFFADGEVVKFGISETLVGGEAVREGLREQSRTTTDWVVESEGLRVTEREGHAWFGDHVAMAWTDTERDRRHEFETRWSGTLERRSGDGEPTTDPAAPWQFVGMHVSTAGEL
jgi:hypothetical protein